MKIITRQTLANEAAEKWKNQYYNSFKNLWSNTMSGGTEDKYYQMIELGKNPNPDDIDRIIGNTSWTNVDNCVECNADNLSTLIELGEEPDFESSTTWLCFNCLTKAFRLMKESYFL